MTLLRATAWLAWLAGLLLLLSRGASKLWRVLPSIILLWVALGRVALGVALRGVAGGHILLWVSHGWVASGHHAPGAPLWWSSAWPLLVGRVAIWLLKILKLFGQLFHDCL